MKTDRLEGSEQRMVWSERRRRHAVVHTPWYAQRLNDALFFCEF